MSALLWIQDKRKTLERIEFVGAIRMAMNASPKEYEKQLERWAKHAEIDLNWND